ncbi:MAG: hypothetical protein KDA85_07510, partial [Planctomycetaceae bacterium]|nr:hypothetical protein [Planctomycetaceae bacterium]
QVVLPGPEVQPRSADPRTTPIVIRIDAVYPHGDDFRYDLTWFGLEPGQHNLSDYLEHQDGSGHADLPAILVNVTSIITAADQLPAFHDQRPRVRAGGYRVAMIAAFVVWIAGLVVILGLRRRQTTNASVVSAASPRDRLREIQELLQRAMNQGSLSASEKADLEARVVAFWRDRRQLSQLTTQQTLAALRTDEEAGPLLTLLERWLYDRPSSVDLQALLQPLHDAVRSPSASVVSVPPSNNATLSATEESA